jgi:hypothetical protein
LPSDTYDIDDEGLRLLANLEQHYASWIEAERILMPGRLAWKTVSARDYLYCFVNGRGLGRALSHHASATNFFRGGRAVTGI